MRHASLFRSYFNSLRLFIRVSTEHQQKSSDSSLRFKESLHVW